MLLPMRLKIIFKYIYNKNYLRRMIYVSIHIIIFFRGPCDQSVININYNFEWMCLHSAHIKVLWNILSCLVIKNNIWYTVRYEHNEHVFLLWIDTQKRTEKDWDLAPANHDCIGQMNITFFVAKLRLI
jgi:hypothetical protein